MANGTPYQRETSIAQVDVFSDDFLNGKWPVIFKINCAANSHGRFFNFPCGRRVFFKFLFGGIDEVRKLAVFNALRGKLVIIPEIVDMDNIAIHRIANLVSQKIRIDLDFVFAIPSSGVRKVNMGQVGEIRFV